MQRAALPTLQGGDVRYDPVDPHAERRADLVCGRTQRVLAARADRDVHPLARERPRARPPEALARRADDRALALDSEIHVRSSSVGEQVYRTARLRPST